VHLPPKELAALRLLLAHTGEVVPPNQIKEALWGDVHVTADSVPKCMSSLRERLGPEDYIQTVYKRGYRFSAEVHHSQAASEAGQVRLAIMPFTTGFNVAPHLGAAIAEEITTLLTAVRSVPALLLARDSVFTLAERGFTAQQVGKELHADLVLAGTLRVLPAHFRLRVEMIRVSDGTELWAEDMLVSQDRAAGLESELARRLLLRLSNGDLSLRPGETSMTEDVGHARRQAHDMFLRGHHEWQNMQRHRMQDGLQHLLRATELDPTLVSAHVDLAHACITQAFFGFMAPRIAAQHVRTAAAAIPPSSEGAETVLPALGWVLFHADHDLPGALHAFAASAHLPHDPATTRLRTMFALSRHRFDEAVELLGAALQADPFSPWLNARLAWAYHLAGDAARSVEQIDRAIDLFPDHEGVNLYASIILAFNNDPERAILRAENLETHSPYFDLGTAVHGYALARAGRLDEAHATLERLQWLSRERFVLSSFSAATCVALGDLEGAMAELRTAAEDRCPWFFQMLADPRMKPLEGHKDFIKMQQVLARMEASVEIGFAHPL
jgi:TolB-like protein/tetratricopeptide (TPR) repeat protein